MPSTEKMHRWSAEHPLPVHVTEGRLTAFLLISPVRPPYLKSSHAVSVCTSELQNGEWSFEFDLNDDRYYQMFKSFYEDVFDSTWEVAPEHAAAKFADIYKEWKKAFSADGYPLTESEIQGIIGEMLIVRDVLIKKYSPAEIVSAWMLDKKGKQDFVFDNEWYEVKSTHIGSNSVNISSVEQLDVPYSGFLAVVKLKKTSSNSTRKITISIMINELLSVFDPAGCGEDFLTKLEDYGLPSDKYENYAYESETPNLYSVAESFPRIIRKDLPTEIGRIQYELYLEPLKKYLVK